MALRWIVPTIVLLILWMGMLVSVSGSVARLTWKVTQSDGVNATSNKEPSDQKIQQVQLLFGGVLQHLALLTWLWGMGIVIMFVTHGLML